MKCWQKIVTNSNKTTQQFFFFFFFLTQQVFISRDHFHIFYFSSVDPWRPFFPFLFLYPFLFISLFSLVSLLPSLFASLSPFFSLRLLSLSPSYFLLYDLPIFLTIFICSISMFCRVKFSRIHSCYPCKSGDPLPWDKILRSFFLLFNYPFIPFYLFLFFAYFFTSFSFLPLFLLSSLCDFFLCPPPLLISFSSLHSLQ